MGGPGSGKRPQPTKLKVLHGETRPSEVGRAEPQPREVSPQAPAWLADDAREVWDRTLEELEAMGLARGADVDALVMYCNAVVNHARAQQAIDREGVLVDGASGGKVRNPATTIVNHNAGIVARFAREFGLTPSARVGLSEPAKLGDARQDAAGLLSG
jgi:P27 family predicted phage terminase small subunit